MGSAPRLSLPIELIQLIIKFAFASPGSPCFQLVSPSTPLASALPLLLVSSAFRQLCLPFFWKSITITHPRDWITLFDRSTGLLCVGEEGKRRWIWVQSLSVVVETAKVPIRPILMLDEDEDVLYRLRIPDYKQLPRLAFVQPSSTTSSSVDDETNDLALEHLNITSPLGLATLKETLRTQHQDLSPRFLAGELQLTIRLAMLHSRLFFLTVLLARTTPRIISSSLALFHQLRLTRLAAPLGYSNEFGNDGPTVELIWKEDALGVVRDDDGWRRRMIKDTCGVFSMVRGSVVRLVGFPDEVREELKGKLPEGDRSKGRWEWENDEMGEIGALSKEEEERKGM